MASSAVVSTNSSTLKAAACAVEETPPPARKAKVPTARSYEEARATPMAAAERVLLRSMTTIRLFTSDLDGHKLLGMF